MVPVHNLFPSYIHWILKKSMVQSQEYSLQRNARMQFSLQQIPSNHWSKQYNICKNAPVTLERKMHDLSLSCCSVFYHPGMSSHFWIYCYISTNLSSLPDSPLIPCLHHYHRILFRTAVIFWCKISLSPDWCCCSFFI